MQEPIKVTQIYTDTSEIPKLFTYAQDKKKRKRISLFLILAMLLSIAIPSSCIEASALSSTYSDTCPYGGNVDNHGFAYAGCFYCGGSGINWGSIYGHSGNNIKIGTGYQTKFYHNVQGATLYYAYRCENCGDYGDYDCKKHTDLIGILAIYDNGDRNFISTNGGHSAGPGQVPIRQCSTCGPILHGSDSSCATTCYSEAKWAVPHVKPVKITASASPSTAGVASSSAYSAKSGIDSVTVSAEAYEGYLFSHWTKNGSNVGGAKGTQLYC